MQLFCDCGLSFVRAKYKLTADQPICCAFAPRYALWLLAAIPNRKKVAIQASFLFFGLWGGLEAARAVVRGVGSRIGKKTML